MSALNFTCFYFNNVLLSIEFIIVIYNMKNSLILPSLVSKGMAINLMNSTTTYKVSSTIYDNVHSSVAYS